MKWCEGVQQIWLDSSQYPVRGSCEHGSE